MDDNRGWFWRLVGKGRGKQAATGAADVNQREIWLAAWRKELAWNTYPPGIADGALATVLAQLEGAEYTQYMPAWAKGDREALAAWGQLLIAHGEALALGVRLSIAIDDERIHRLRYLATKVDGDQVEALYATIASLSIDQERARDALLQAADAAGNTRRILAELEAGADAGYAAAKMEDIITRKDAGGRTPLACNSWAIEQFEGGKSKRDIIDEYTRRYDIERPDNATTATQTLNDLHRRWRQKTTNHDK